MIDFGRYPNPQPAWRSDDCAQNNTHLRIGGENYVRSADDKLTPSKKNQPPPDLRYFGQAGK